MRYILLSNFLNKIWREEAVPGPHPYAKFHRCGFKNVGLQPPKSRIIVIFGINLPLRENSGGWQKKLNIGEQLQTTLYAMTP